jgi:hypothetical protein
VVDIHFRKFKTARVSEPQTSAELIIAHVLGKKMVIAVLIFAS